MESAIEHLSDSGTEIASSNFNFITAFSHSFNFLVAQDHFDLITEGGEYILDITNHMSHVNAGQLYEFHGKGKIRHQQ
uniref:Uncharacterized protein n=1 Tax=Gossypium raimondii TaxID=29730 RepID=A0A0D2NNR9_GOSRA|nr:hypothetical protein B456_002G158000 [Gossypium raimondii]